MLLPLFFFGSWLVMMDLETVWPVIFRCWSVMLTPLSSPSSTGSGLVIVGIRHNFLHRCLRNDVGLIWNFAWWLHFGWLGDFLCDVGLSCHFAWCFDLVV